MSNKKNKPMLPPNEIIFYETEDGKISIAVRDNDPQVCYNYHVNMRSSTCLNIM